EPLGATTLVVLGQQRVLTDVGEVQPNEIFVVAIHAIFGHHRSLSYQRSTGLSRISPVPTGELGLWTMPRSWRHDTEAGQMANTASPRAWSPCTGGGVGEGFSSA